MGRGEKQGNTKYKIITFIWIKIIYCCKIIMSICIIKNHINIEILTSPKFKINIYKIQIKLIFRKYIKLRYKLFLI